MPWYMWSMMGKPVVTAFGTACYDLIDVCHVISRVLCRCSVLRRDTPCSFIGMYGSTVDVPLG